ncbi:MAG: polysaccharide biosynthesis protein [Acidimicrobiales bacterium]|nr:polysaccharide biosynthesis protein [Acidimicrobiales bacterium]
MGNRGRGHQTTMRAEQVLPERVYLWARGTEGLSLVLLDVGIVFGAWCIATAAALAALERSMSLGTFLAGVALATIVQIVLHRAAGMYGPVWRYASVEEALRVVTGVLVGSLLATLALALVRFGTDHFFPLVMAPPLAALLSLLACGGVRFQARLFAVSRISAAEVDERLRTVIVGTANDAAPLANELRTTATDRELEVVGFIPTDPSLPGKSLRGIPVLGTVDELEDVCRKHRVERILITTSPNDQGTPYILERALATDAQVKVLPASADRVKGPLVNSLRDIDVTDLLGRKSAVVDGEGIEDYIRGATVLVTGAGGSIGSEISRQVSSYGPAKLIVLDRDETLLYELMSGSLAGSGAVPVLADICDSVFIQQLFRQHRPDVVFHAAAQKHVPILEHFPTEAVRVNVLGTLTVAQTAADSGCRRFVHISTDKAADPCSVMGATKRAAEQVVFEIGRRHDLAFVAVRFGNVLASRGSVVPTFLRQILDGGPVTVTSAEMTRYFMTIPEAVSLVLQAGSMAVDDARVYLLDMGDPVPILSLARQMIRLAGLRPEEDIEIRITGIRPGERLHERLHDDAEVVEPAGHPSISALDPKATWDWEELAKQLEGLRSAVRQRDEQNVRGRLEDMLRAGGVDVTLRDAGSRPGWSS